MAVLFAKPINVAFLLVPTTPTIVFFVQGIELKEVLKKLANDVDEFDPCALLF